MSGDATAVIEHIQPQGRDLQIRHTKDISRLTLSSVFANQQPPLGDRGLQRTDTNKEGKSLEQQALDASQDLSDPQLHEELRRILPDIRLERGGFNHFQRVSRDSLPPAVNTLTVLTHDYLAHQYTPENRKTFNLKKESPRQTPTIIRKVTEIIGSGSREKATYASQIIEFLKETNSHEHPGDNQKRNTEANFDLAVITALSAQSPQATETAIELFTRVNEVFPNTDTALRDASFRMTDTFRRIFSVLPLENQRNLAACLSTLGEGKFTGAASALAEEGGIRTIKDLKDFGQSILEQIIWKDRQEWAKQIEISDEKAAAQMLHPEPLDQLVESVAIQDADTWKGLQEQISTRVQAVVDRETANGLMVQLLETLNPNTSFQGRMEQVKKAAANGNAYHPPSSNGVIALTETRQALPPEEKRKKIADAAGKFPWQNNGATALVTGETTTMKEFIQVLVHPVLVNAAVEKLGESAKVAAMEYVKKRLVPGIQFLKACAQDPLIARIVDHEFGFLSYEQGSSIRGRVFSEEYLQQAEAALQKNFSAGTETQDQPQDISHVAQAMLTESARLLGETRTKVVSIVDGKIQSSTREKIEQAPVAPSDYDSQLQQEQTTASERIATLQAQRTVLENTKPSGRWRRVFSNGMSQEDITRRINALDTEILQAQTDSDTIGILVQNGAEASAKARIKPLEARIQRLQQLLNPTPAPEKSESDQ